MRACVRACVCMHEYVYRAGPRIQTAEVVRMAATVPVGIDFCASAKSPDRLEPAMMPEHTNNEYICRIQNISTTFNKIKNFSRHE